MPASPEMSQYGDGMAPHPLQPPMVPIAPVFARPSTATSRDVKFAATPIMRGETEDTVLRPRGAQGDDFWRRFSMVAKEDMATPPGQKQSMWLRKTQNGTTRMSRWVWFIGLVLLIVSTFFYCIAMCVHLGCRLSPVPLVWVGGFRTTTLRTLPPRRLAEAQTRSPPSPLLPPPPKATWQHHPARPCMYRRLTRSRGALTSLYRRPLYTPYTLAARNRTAFMSSRRTTAAVAAVL